MKILSQNDPRWAATKIGDSKLTVGRFGCALTSVVNLANALGVNKMNLTPGDLAKDVACFTPDGLVIWEKLCQRINPRFHFAGRETFRNDRGILAAIKDPQRGVILNVSSGAHFVLGWSKPFFGSDFTVADPWDGKKVGAIAKYHDIVGARYFQMN